MVKVNAVVRAVWPFAVGIIKNMAADGSVPGGAQSPPLKSVHLAGSVRFLLLLLLLLLLHVDLSGFFLDGW